MRKEGWRPNSPASFYKIILPSTLVDNKLRIPEKFVSAHGNELSTVITLIIPDGCSWKVGMKKSEDMLCFSDGWQNLVDHYSISPGDFLIFKYQGHSTFSVLIFDMTSAEIHYPNRTLTSFAPPDNCPEWLTSDKEEMDSHDSLESNLNENDASTSRRSETVGKPRADRDNGLESNQCENVDLEKNYVGKKKFDHTMGADEPEGNPRRRRKVQYGQSRDSVTTDGINLISPCVANFKHNSGLESSVVKSEEEASNRGIFTDIFMATKLTSQERERATHAVRMFTSKNPSFMVILRPSSFRPTHLVVVPAKFCESYMHAPGIKVELEVSDERWPVSTVRKHTRSLCLSRGWAAFAKENGLSIGDICVFELIQIKDIVLKVSIFRANEDVNTCQRSN